MYSNSVKVFILHQKDPLEFEEADFVIEQDGSLNVKALEQSAKYESLAVFRPDQWRHAVRVPNTSK